MFNKPPDTVEQELKEFQHVISPPIILVRNHSAERLPFRFIITILRLILS